MKELPIHIQLHPESSKTLYEQIYEYIREEIKSGSLMQKEKLPSARFLADYLQVSRTTVDMAYDQLVSEGYLEAKPRRGYFVSTYEELSALNQALGQIPGRQDGVKGMSRRGESGTEPEAERRGTRPGVQGREPDRKSVV